MPQHSPDFVLKDLFKGIRLVTPLKTKLKTILGEEKIQQPFDILNHFENHFHFEVMWLWEKIPQHFEFEKRYCQKRRQYLKNATTF